VNREQPAGPAAEAISVVIPFFDEEACVEALLDEVARSLDGHGIPFEVLAVDDGSTDRTGEILAARAAADPRIRVLRSERNRGQAAALWRGLHAAARPIVVTLDGDGQNDPADIPRLLAELGGPGGLDMVVGIRQDRHDSWLRRGMSRLANAVRGRLLGDRMRDSGCALKAFRHGAVASFIPLQTLYSFMPAMAVAAGLKVGQLPVNHRPRAGGTSSYGLRQFLWRPLLDLLGMWWFLRRRIRPG